MQNSLLLLQIYCFKKLRKICTSNIIITKRIVIVPKSKVTACQQKSRGIQSQIRAISGGHIDDSIHTVDKEEKGDEIHKHVFLLFCLAEGGSDLTESM